MNNGSVEDNQQLLAVQPLLGRLPDKVYVGGPLQEIVIPRNLTKSNLDTVLLRIGGVWLSSPQSSPITSSLISVLLQI